MQFKDRTDAGKQLAAALMAYKNHPNAIVIGLPRGGVVTAFEVARALGLKLDIVVPRKIGAPDNPELAIGAITEDGTRIFNHDLISQLGVSQSQIERIIEEERREAARRLKTYRAGRPPLNVEGKLVILVDDGIATGSTMKAAIASLKAKKAAKIVVAIPVGPTETIEELKMIVDEVVCLTTPSPFFAIGAFYVQFEQTTDEEVISLLNPSHERPSA